MILLLGGRCPVVVARACWVRACDFALPCVFYNPVREIKSCTVIEEMFVCVDRFFVLRANRKKKTKLLLQVTLTVEP